MHVQTRSYKLKNTPHEIQASATPARVCAYFIGTFGFEFASKALQVTFPLLLLNLSNSLSAVGFISALNAALDTTGTLLGGCFSHRLHPRKLLIVSTAVRSVSLGLLPVLWSSGFLTLQLATGVYLLDSLVRGVADTARNTMPLMLAGNDRIALDRLNSRYQTILELGSVAGSFLVGFMLITFGALSAHWSVAVAFGVAAMIYARMPKTAESAIGERPLSSKPSLQASISVVASNPGLRLSLVGIILLTLYPLKALLPVFFADSILRAPEQAAWLTGLFGIGAVTGALLYGCFSQKHSPCFWLRLSAAGVVFLAFGWIPESFLSMAVSVFLFALSNVMARLAMTSTLQSQIPYGAEGHVMGATRFSVNLTSMIVRFLVGLAFAVAAAPMQGFAFVGAGVAVFALLAVLV
ncbi:MAG: MFS transporter, partial [Candidatus Binatia bacterium]